MVEKQTAAKTKVAPKTQAIADLANEQAERMRQRAVRGVEQTKNMREIGDKLQNALARGDVDQVKILTADFETARASVQATSRDLAQVIQALDLSYKEMGIQTAGLKTYNDEEKKIIEDAEKILNDAKNGKRDADQELVRAGDSLNLFGIRNRAVRAGQESVSAAQALVDIAEAGVVAAKELASQKQRERLISANLSTSLQNLQVISQHIIQISTEQVDVIQEDLEATTTRREAVSARIEELTQNLNVLEKSVGTLEAQLSTLRDQQNELQQGTPERAALETEILTKESERDQAKAEHTSTFALLQNSQTFLDQYKIHVATQRQNLEFQKVWIRMMEHNVEERTTLYDSHLGALQSAANQEAMSKTDLVASAADQRVAEDMAQMGAATQRAMMERIERSPKDTRDMRAVLNAQVQSRADFEKKLAEQLGHYQHNYGTSDGYDSVVGHREKDSAAAA